jgi:hypothetical protein
MKFIYSILLSLVSLAAFAQADSISYQKIAKAVCQCIDTSKIDPISMRDFENEIKSCIFNYMENNLKDIGIDSLDFHTNKTQFFSDNNNKYLVLGIIYSLRDCPKVFRLMSSLVESNFKEEPKREEPKRDSLEKPHEEYIPDTANVDRVPIKPSIHKESGDIVGYGYQRGRVLRLEQKPYPFLLIADSSDREHRFIWRAESYYMNPFIKEYPKNIGKWVDISWQDTYWYDVKTKDYELFKACTHLNILSDSGTVDYDTYNKNEGVIEGVLAKKFTKRYTFLRVIDQDGKSLDFIWLYSFNLDEELRRKFKDFRGKKVKIDWKTVTLLDVKSKQNIEYQSINWIELIE